MMGMSRITALWHRDDISHLLPGAVALINTVYEPAGRPSSLTVPILECRHYVDEPLAGGRPPTARPMPGATAWPPCPAPMDRMVVSGAIPEAVVSRWVSSQSAWLR